MSDAQTGTGKTHTIWGEERPEEARGVNYRTISELFQVAEQRGAETEYSFLVSMLEVYNDQVRASCADVRERPPDDRCRVQHTPVCTQRDANRVESL